MGGRWGAGPPRLLDSLDHRSSLKASAAMFHGPETEDQTQKAQETQQSETETGDASVFNASLAK